MYSTKRNYKMENRYHTWQSDDPGPGQQPAEKMQMDSILHSFPMAILVPKKENVVVVKIKQKYIILLWKIQWKSKQRAILVKTRHFDLKN
jgi:hypothetical protein